MPFGLVLLLYLLVHAGFHYYVYISSRSMLIALPTHCCILSSLQNMLLKFLPRTCLYFRTFHSRINILFKYKYEYRRRSCKGNQADVLTFTKLFNYFPYNASLGEEKIKQDVGLHYTGSLSQECQVTRVTHYLPLILHTNITYSPPTMSRVRLTFVKKQDTFMK